MSIIRIKKRETPYVQIDKRCLEDTRLSWRARGVLAYLLSKPDNWQVSVADIKSKGLEGRDAILKSLKELEKIGYASFGPTRGKDGKVCGTAWTITEEPTTGFSVCRSSTESLKNRKSEKPIIGKSVPSNNEYNSNNEKEKEVKAAMPLEPPFVHIEDIYFEDKKKENAPPVAPPPPQFTVTVTKPIRQPLSIHSENTPVLAHFSDPAKMADLWQKWLQYKWGEHKQKYKTAESEVTQLRILWQRCKGNTETAAQIIEQSVGNLWKGLFDLKEEKNVTLRTTNKATEQHLALANFVIAKRIARENE